MQKTEIQSINLLLALVILVIIYLIYALWVDIKLLNKRKYYKICHNNGLMQKCVKNNEYEKNEKNEKYVKHIIQKQINKDYDKKSKVKKIIHSSATGAVRGFLAGMLMSGTNGAIANSVIFAVVNPAMHIIEESSSPNLKLKTK
jgi:predicted Holliday junction resolvase-like endonuclease